LIGGPCHFTARTVRLIANANHKPSVLGLLAESYGAQEQLAALEGATSERQIVQQEGLPGLAPSQLATSTQTGWTFINASFAYKRAGGSRFNTKDWGAWYSTTEVDAGLAEVAFHFTRALADASNSFDNTTVWIELWADFDDVFHDLRGIDPEPECLHADCDIGYPAGQALAEELRLAGLNGIVYPSVRYPGATNLVAFWPQLVRNYRQGARWKMTWSGTPDPEISRF